MTANSKQRKCSVARRAVIVSRLADELAQAGRIPTAAYRDAAAVVGVTERQMRRLVRTCVETGHVRHPSDRHTQRAICPGEPADETDRLVSELIHHNGNATAVYESLGLQGQMSVRTLQRRINALPAIFKAAASEGYRGAVKYGLYSQIHIPCRGYLYSMDHSQLPIQALPERGTNPVWVWYTSVMDMRSRVVLSYRLSVEQPNTEITTDTLVEAIVGWEDGDRGFVGGKPEFVHSDRGSDFVGQVMTLGLLNLDIGRRFTEPYSSWQNPVTERHHGTIDRQFAPTVPGFTAGGQDEYTKRVLRVATPVQALLTIPQLDVLLGEFLHEYNNRPHSSLNGKTPLEVWHEDPTPMPRIEREVLRASLMRRETRTVGKQGIQLRNRTYACGALLDYRDRRVEVRYLEHNTGWIHVYYNGKFVCEAPNVAGLTAKERLGVVSARQKAHRQIQAASEASARRKVDEARDRLEESRRVAAADALPEWGADTGAPAPDTPSDTSTPTRKSKRSKKTTKNRPADSAGKGKQVDHINSLFEHDQDKAS